MIDVFTYAQTNRAKGEMCQVPKQRARCESTLKLLKESYFKGF